MAGLRAGAGGLVNAIEARRRRQIARRILGLHPFRVVDVGCEDGWIAESYVEQVGELWLVDLDPAVLARGPLRSHPRVTCVVADAAAPRALEQALASRRADVIVLSALLEHVPEPRAALTALAPLLLPGGRFLIYLPADGPILLAKAVLRRTHLGGWLRGLPLEPAPGHLQRFDRRAVATLVRPFGRVEEITFDPLCLGYLAVVRRP